jgi:hypothetical protein
MHRLRALQVLAWPLLLLLTTPSAFAWGPEGHSMINQLAAEKLPADVPAFLKTPAAIAEIAYLGPEPDRWRSPLEPELNSAQAPEHFIDLEYADMVGKLPRKRFDYIAALYAAGLIHPDMARELRPERAGLLPYEATEVFERLQAALRAYRNLKAKNVDTVPVEQAAIFYAGWLGHYVGDGSQPLHATQNYNGWTMKDNPHNYANDHTIHWRFEGTFVAANIHAADVEPMVSPVHVIGDPFEDFVAYLRVSQSKVERVYQLDQQSGFTGSGTPESRKFTEERLAAGASMLRDMIDTAWVNSAKIPSKEYE